MDIEIITPFNLVAGYGALNVTLLLFLMAQLGGLNADLEARRITMRQWVRSKRDLRMLSFALWLIMSITTFVIYVSFLVE